jgi:hypothetical protein
MAGITESVVEDVALVYFGAIGAAIKRGVEIDDAGERGGVAEVMLQGRLTAALHRLNPDLAHDTIEEVVRILSRPPHPTLIQNNRWFHALLTDGVEIEYRDARMGDGGGETRGGRARLVDFDNPAANALRVVRQLSVAGASGKIIRPDLTVFLNGLPVAVIELKDPTDTQADLGVAIDQLDRYMQTAPDLFVPNLVRVVSDGMLTRVGSITSGRNRFMPWRPLNDDGGAPTSEALICGLFEPRALVDYLRTCVTFEEDERGEIAKKIAGYHPFRAVRKARASVLKALRSNHPHPGPLPRREGERQGDGHKYARHVSSASESAVTSQIPRIRMDDHLEWSFRKGTPFLHSTFPSGLRQSGMELFGIIKSSYSRQGVYEIFQARLEPRVVGIIGQSSDHAPFQILFGDLAQVVLLPVFAKPIFFHILEVVPTLGVISTLPVMWIIRGNHDPGVRRADDLLFGKAAVDPLDMVWSRFPGIRAVENHPVKRMGGLSEEFEGGCGVDRRIVLTGRDKERGRNRLRSNDLCQTMHLVGPVERERLIFERVFIVHETLPSALRMEPTVQFVQVGQTSYRGNLNRRREQKESVHTEIMQALINAEGAPSRESKQINLVRFLREGIHAKLHGLGPRFPGDLNQIAWPRAMTRQQDGEHPKTVLLKKAGQILGGIGGIGQPMRHQDAAGMGSLLAGRTSGIGRQRKRGIPIQNPLKVGAVWIGPSVGDHLTALCNIRLERIA